MLFLQLFLRNQHKHLRPNTLQVKTNPPLNPPSTNLRTRSTPLVTINRLLCGVLPHRRPLGGGRCIIYNPAPNRHHAIPGGETFMPPAGQLEIESYKIMGDKSPKSNQKKASQKQAIANSADQKRKQEIAAKQAALKKR